MLSAAKHFVNSLLGNLAIIRDFSPEIKTTPTPIIEVIYIDQIYQVNSAYIVKSDDPIMEVVDHEIEIETDAICYFIQQDNHITKTKQQNILFNTSRTEIIPLSDETIIGLLTDNDKLIRQAATDWYQDRI